MADLTCQQTIAVADHRILTEDLNEHNTLYGGRILEWVDNCSSISASRFASGQVVTASFDAANFYAPVKLGDSLRLKSYVSGAGHRSLEVFVKGVGTNLTTKENYLAFSAFVIYVMPDKTAAPLPTLTPTTEEEVTLVEGYKARQEVRKAAKKLQATTNRALTLD